MKRGATLNKQPHGHAGGRHRDKRSKSDRHHNAPTSTRAVDNSSISFFNLTPNDSPSKLVCEERGRQYTVSIALPGSVLSNLQTPELKTYLVGQIGRACSLFNVDEIIVYEDNAAFATATASLSDNEDAAHEPSASTTTTGPYEPSSKKNLNQTLFTARLLEYLETPIYLRKQLFPVHRDLKYAGLLNALEIPSHVKLEQPSLFREGITTEQVYQGTQTVVDVGLRKMAVIDAHLQAGLRVTVKMPSPYTSAVAAATNARYITGCTVVAPDMPKQAYGLYWGYRVRVATSLAKVFEECPYGVYDVTVGTSKKGNDMATLLDWTPSITTETTPEDNQKENSNKFRHLLIVLGGQTSLQDIIDADETLAINGDQAREMFDFWINTCPNQGTRTIRTEEALLVTLANLSTWIEQNGLLST